MALGLDFRTAFLAPDLAADAFALRPGFSGVGQVPMPLGLVALRARFVAARFFFIAFMARFLLS